MSPQYYYLVVGLVCLIIAMIAVKSLKKRRNEDL